MIAFFKDEQRRGVLFLVLSGISLIISFFDMGHLPVNAAWVAILLCGVPILKGAAVALVTEFDVKADLLVSLALIASVAIGETFAAGEVAFIMTIGAMLEERTVAKARAGIEKLVNLTPRTARVIRGETEVVIPAEQVQSGDILRILAGETIPVDGIILSGHSSIDQSVMTGEPLPVDKAPGDEVMSGTVNQFGTFDMRSTKVGEDSSLQRMIRLVESADAGKAKIVGIADRWATWIVAIALVSAGATWAITGQIIRAVTILVVFCPCALVLATPTAIMAAIGNASKHGILVREGDALERLATVSHIAFDKTGTLTYGQPVVQESRSFLPGMDDESLFAMCAQAERLSEHPIGKAITRTYREHQGTLPAEPERFVLLAGQGIEATLEGGRQVLAGNVELLCERGVEVPEAVRAAALQVQRTGATVVFAAVDGIAAGFVALSDTLREDAAGVVAALKRIGVVPVLLTGDHAQSACDIAGKVCIDAYEAGCRPGDKLERISAMQAEGHQVCMVGDGINDAPALKKAYVGIAMSGIGSDIAIDAADIALVRDDIRWLPHLFRLSGRMMRTIMMNLTLSLLLNFVAILLAMTGVLGPVVGALVHNVGSVVVIINSATLLHCKHGGE